ncbi:hypothetical protein BOX15_Mlig025213g2 [Macrostomum lignano]|uniref:Nuclear receptor domain-containing protein n=1 Tax=Macrostomum lignano TaxID=282301 RepID=A0A267GAD8_9PLAT|nr:hypothetical protein BOX15_Mlig025213g2 [Macrostomum lignano]
MTDSTSSSISLSIPTVMTAQTSEDSSQIAPALKIRRTTNVDSVNNGTNGKVCTICGDKALGYNFDAISCESCKAFFRRNALKAEIPDCMFSQRCNVTVATRRFCTSCRLKKCLECGMRPELVNADELRGRKSLLRRRIDLPDDTSTLKSSPLSSVTKPLVSLATGPPLKLEASEADDLLADSSSSPADHPQQLPQPPLSLPNFANSVSSNSLHGQVESMHMRVGRQPVIASAPPLHNPDQLLVLSAGSDASLTVPGGRRCLSHEQWLAVADLKQAYEQSFSDASDDTTPAGCRDVNNLVNSSGFIVKKLILFAKKLPDFVSLSQPCQIALLKGVVICTLFLRSAVHYHRDRDVWLTPKGEVPTAILKEIPGFAELYDDHLRFCRQFKLLFQDPYLVPIVQVLLLFTPDRPSVGDRTLVSNVQDRYICLLKHYLEGRTSFTEARRKLPKILLLLEDLQDLAERHGRLLLHVNPAEVDPLLLEVFDIAVKSSSAAPVATSTSTAVNIGGVDSLAGLPGAAMFSLSRMGQM